MMRNDGGGSSRGLRSKVRPVSMIVTSSSGGVDSQINSLRDEEARQQQGQQRQNSYRLSLQPPVPTKESGLSESQKAERLRKEIKRHTASLQSLEHIQSNLPYLSGQYDEAEMSSLVSIVAQTPSDPRAQQQARIDAELQANSQNHGQREHGSQAQPSSITRTASVSPVDSSAPVPVSRHRRQSSDASLFSNGNLATRRSPSGLMPSKRTVSSNTRVETLQASLDALKLELNEARAIGKEEREQRIIAVKRYEQCEETLQLLQRRSDVHLQHVAKYERRIAEMELKIKQKNRRIEQNNMNEVALGNAAREADSQIVRLEEINKRIDNEYQMLSSSLKSSNSRNAQNIRQISQQLSAIKNERSSDLEKLQKMNAKIAEQEKLRVRLQLIQTEMEIQRKRQVDQLKALFDEMKLELVNSDVIVDGKIKKVVNTINQLEMKYMHLSRMTAKHACEDCGCDGSCTSANGEESALSNALSASESESESANVSIAGP